MKLRTSIVLVLGLSLPTLCTAQEILTNKSIVAMKNAGLSSDLIIKTITDNPGNYQTDPQTMVNLKRIGLEERVIIAMKNKGVATASIPIQATAPSQDTYIDKIRKLGPGIYYFDKDSIVQSLEPNLFTEVRGKSFLNTAVSGIFNAKAVAYLNGIHANVDIATSSPKFYFYFSPNQNGFSQQNIWLGEATSPNEFVLVKFSVSNGKREITLGKQNNVSSSSGIEKKSQVDFKFRKVENGLYEVYPNQTLLGGEYGIMYGNMQEQQKVYDFSIKQSSTQ